MLENHGEDINHLAITAGLAQHLILQLPEGRRQSREWRTVSESPGLALKDGQIVPPVIDRPWWHLVAPLDDTAMLAQDVAFCRYDQPVRIDPQADRPVGKGRRHAIAIDSDCARS